MNDDLQQLLSKADAEAGPMRPGLADAVRKRVDRRRKHRRLARGLAVSVVVAGIAIAFLPRQSVPLPVVQHPVDVEGLRREIASLDAQAKLHLRIATEMEKSLARSQKVAAARFLLSQPDAITRLNEHRQATAQLMLSHAEQLEVDPRRKAEAIQSYRTLAELFPQTPAGHAATARLSNGV